MPEGGKSNMETTVEQTEIEVEMVKKKPAKKRTTKGKRHTPYFLKVRKPKKSKPRKSK
jgi:phage anti-repressor protein